MKIHGLDLGSIDFVKAKFNTITYHELLSFGIHGVSKDFFLTLEKKGLLSELSPTQVIKFRNSGIF